MATSPSYPTSHTTRRDVAAWSAPPHPEEYSGQVATSRFCGSEMYLDRLRRAGPADWSRPT